ncbi:MAG: DpnI domain-containing protein, partial [Clostridia bacterium]|nr:DpnI domain-containing protein [Clostridia bacterium]
MDYGFDLSLAKNYKSQSQIIRVLTENWVGNNISCPRCGNPSIAHFENNRPVSDFFCPVCKSQFELKSKSGAIGKKISDGAYDT